MKKEEVSIVLTEEQLKQCKEAEKKVANIMKKAEIGYLSIAGRVRRLTELQYYEVEGYKNNESYMRERFGMARVTCYRLCNISRRFGDPETYEILPEYEKVSVRNLVMASEITEEQFARLPENWGEMASTELHKIIKGMKAIEEKEKIASGEEGSEPETEASDRVKEIYVSDEIKETDDLSAARDAIGAKVREVLEKAVKGERIKVTIELV